LTACRINYYQEKHPELFETLEQQVKLLKETLGALYAWLKALVEKLPKRRFHGKPAEDIVASEQIQEDMFDEAMEYAASINVDPDAIEQALLSTPPKRIIELLSSGLEEEQKRQIEAEKEQETTTQLTATLDNFRKLLGRGE
jgi:hypothetical protein